MFGHLTKTSSIALAIFAIAPLATALPSLKPNEMKSAVDLSNTAFKGCVTQSQLYATGASKMSRSELSTAKKANKAADQRLASRLNTIPAAAAQTNRGLGRMSLGSLIGADTVAATPQGLSFSLGNGYASQVQSWLQPFNAGNPTHAAALLAHEGPSKIIQQRNYRNDPSKLADQTVANKIGVLGLAERATVSLSGGDLECTVNFLDFGIQASDRQQGTFWGADLEPYEHIMAVNMKAMAYLLSGDERARNMAQASRELQARAREEYAAALAEEQQNAEQESSQRGLPNQTEWLDLFNAAFNDSALSSNPEMASRMASPYVNPLADYLSAVIAETEASAGTGTLDEWSRASIAWKNASTLAPSTGFLSAASDQTRAWQRSSPPNGKKIVNVLVAMGAAPTDAVSRMYFNYQGSPFPVMMPVKVSQQNGFTSGSISAGATTASLEMVSDVESMVMRAYEDRRSGEMLTALLRGWIAYEAGKAVGSNSGNAITSVLGNVVRDSLAEPATNSWSSLPAGYMAARIVVPVDQSQVTVTVPGIGTETFDVNADQATFVFASVRSNRLWGQAQSAAFGGDRLDFEVQ